MEKCFALTVGSTLTPSASGSLVSLCTVVILHIPRVVVVTQTEIQLGG